MELKKESYLYWECMMAKYVDCGHRKKKKYFGVKEALTSKK
jgi:hypothetical protein